MEEAHAVQSTLIVQLHSLTYFQLILTLASCAKQSDFNQYNVLVLDILHLVFRSVKAKDLLQDQARVRYGPVVTAVAKFETDTHGEAREAVGSGNQAEKSAFEGRHDSPFSVWHDSGCASCT